MAKSLTSSKALLRSYPLSGATWPPGLKWQTSNPTLSGTAGPPNLPLLPFPLPPTSLISIMGNYLAHLPVFVLMCQFLKKLFITEWAGFLGKFLGGSCVCYRVLQGTLLAVEEVKFCASCFSLFKVSQILCYCDPLLPASTAQLRESFMALSVLFLLTKLVQKGFCRPSPVLSVTPAWPTNLQLLLFWGLLPQKVYIGWYFLRSATTASVLIIFLLLLFPPAVSA